MSQPDIVKIIQRCDTWSDVRDDGMGKSYVRVYFNNMRDAEAFKVELMMVASGQHGYEKPADQQETSKE